MGINSCGTTLIDQGTFKNIGAVSWDTTAKTAGFTAVAGNGYFVNTTSGAITVTLPSSPTAGDTVGIADYANTADTNNITIGRNGSNIQGVANDFVINTEGGTIILTYVDATKGWLSIDAAQASDITKITFVAATGGTVTCCGDYKIHTFTGPGTFTVTCAGSSLGSNSVDYLVIAGGGGGGGRRGAGGGAGGFRTNYPSCNSGLPVSATTYPITVGGGAAGGPGATSVTNSASSGSNSIFSTITSTGGGGGAGDGEGLSKTGGSGGGGSGGGGGGPGSTSGAAGNTPPVSPPQGTPGGNGAGAPNYGSGGGGGIGGGGSNGTPTVGGNGGCGTSNSITGSPIIRAGGGGGATYQGGTSGSGGSGGGGAAGAGGTCNPGVAGTTNTGGGGGGGSIGPADSTGRDGGAGGSGIVVIRYKYQ